MFELELTPAIITFYSVLAACFLYLILGFRHYITSVFNKVLEDNNKPLPERAEDYPSVSVIVYSEDDAQNLETLLVQILTQDYPASKEVIVVNDGAMGTTKDVIARLEQHYSNLYMTFTPLESRSLSRKKLAITLGVKAARYETVILTTGNCIIESKTWLKSMMRHFSAGKEIVIGYATPRPTEDAGSGIKRRHAFDTVWTAIEYLSWSIAGRPYRACCYNLAYKRSIFFRNKGFSKSLNLKFGDDDIFINEVSNGQNTATELSTASIVEISETSSSAQFKRSKLRYDYTAKRLKTWARLYFSSCSWAWWLAIASSVAVSIIGLPSLLPTIISVAVILTMWIILMISWKRTSTALGSRPLFLTFPWLMCYHPIFNLYYRIKGYIQKENNFTWV
ncbi:MAG: glycosyltransferase [Muribaculaceae bacterium]|nr:glycosyltransferase [Muribaculum sp.]MCM1295318.1 glycosyltransferase [Muribaculaceae bacterium]